MTRNADVTKVCAFTCSDYDETGQRLWPILWAQQIIWLHADSQLHISAVERLMSLLREMDAIHMAGIYD